MTPQRSRTESSDNRPAPAGYFPVQREIQQLEEELNVFIGRIADLYNEDYQSCAVKVLKANAMDFARRIDELRSLLNRV